MIFSLEQLLSDGQNLTATGASTNTIDLGASGTVLGAPTSMVRDVGKGRPVAIVVQLDEDATGTSPTLDVDLEVDDNTSFSSATVVASAQQIAGGSAGDRVSIFYLPEGTNERYMRLNYTLGGTTPDYTVTAGIVLADFDRLMKVEATKPGFYERVYMPGETFDIPADRFSDSWMKKAEPEKPKGGRRGRPPEAAEPSAEDQPEAETEVGA